MKPKHIFLITAVLGLLIAQAYIGLGLGQRLTLFKHALLWGALASTCLGLYAGLSGRARLAICGWSVAVLVLVWLQIDHEMSLAGSRAKTAEANRLENELLLANALARAPCGNGDVATLQMLNNPHTDRYSLSIQIVPAKREEKNNLLVSTSGEYRPPSDQAVRAYQSRTMTDCHSPEYASLAAMMARLQAHYAAERHKYPK